MTAPELRRCAIYTRKSVEDGLDQQFNSLHAQREACEAYVKSQAHEGWKALDTHYDDGGFSGGSMARPGLQQLLKDIAAGKVDIVVCYKLDRLSRSLPDFARMVELFDKHEVSFVSITQQFSTTNSMGRLTLNMLLSFAQFEREVTGERIRDKIAASKAKGLWMGGNLPLGYGRPPEGSRILEVNEKEAKTVRLIFRKYLELQSVHRLADWLKDKAIGPKRWTSSRGKKMGGSIFSRGALFHLLRNPIYRGMIRHKGLLHEGGHLAIVDERTFEKVQLALNAAANRHKDKNNLVARAPLTGKLFDAAGEPMSPTFSHGRKGKLYRYYVSTSLQKGGAPSKDRQLLQRLPANSIERQVTHAVQRLCTAHPEPLKLIKRVDVGAGAIGILVDRERCDGIEARLKEGETCAEDAARTDCLRITLPLRVRNLRGRNVVELAHHSATRPDPALIGALRKAHASIKLDGYRLPTCTSAPKTLYERRILQLAFLAPDIQDQILDGRQPRRLGLTELIKHPLPVCWEAQRKLVAELAGIVPSTGA